MKSAGARSNLAGISLSKVYPISGGAPLHDLDRALTTYCALKGSGHLPAGPKFQLIEANGAARKSQNLTHLPLIQTRQQELRDRNSNS
jgi:hypothetical protein